MGVEALEKSKPDTKPKTVRLRSDLIEKIEKMAREQNRNFSNMVETLLINHLKL